VSAEPSPELTLLVEEARALRAEHDQRIGKQQDVTQLALATIAALVVLVSAAGQRNDPLKSLSLLRPLFPLASLLLSGFTLMALDHDMNIAHIQRYLQEDLGPRIARAAGLVSDSRDKIWQWVAFRARLQQHSGRWTPATVGMAIAKYVVTLLPNLGLLLAYLTVGGPSLSLLSKASFGAACIVLLVALLAGAYVGVAYVNLEYLKKLDPTMPGREPVS
jgi:hypothetical protein